MQRRLSLYLDKEISLEGKREIAISSEESFSTQKESLQHPSEASPPNTKGTKRCLVKKNRRGYLDTLFGITPLSYSREHPPRCPDDSSLSPRAKSPKHRSL